MKNFLINIPKLIIIILAILACIFIMNDLSEPYFAERKEIKEALRLQNNTPKIVNCKNCGYAELSQYFGEYCKVCGKVKE